MLGLCGLKQFNFLTCLRSVSPSLVSISSFTFQKETKKVIYF